MKWRTCIDGRSHPRKSWATHFMATQHKAGSSTTLNQLLPSIGSSAWSGAHNSSARQVGPFSMELSLGLRAGQLWTCLRLRETSDLAATRATGGQGLCRRCREVLGGQPNRENPLSCDSSRAALSEHFPGSNLNLGRTTAKGVGRCGDRQCSSGVDAVEVSRNDPLGGRPKPGFRSIVLLGRFKSRKSAGRAPGAAGVPTVERVPRAETERSHCARARLATWGRRGFIDWLPRGTAQQWPSPRA